MLAVSKYPVTLKRRGWSPMASCLIIIAVLGTWFIAPNFFLVTLLLLAVTYGFSIALRFLLMEKHELRMEGEWLIEYDFRGREIGRLNLNKPFEAEYLFKGYLDALYQLTQDDRRLRFSARTRGAPQVIKEILQLQWPPRKRYTGFP